ncbi:hypothetical protein [Roseisalinus antarcticus]|uniref:Uncharacterized protein n=1 Tax=Roseisalinus antarcticus TaxID=254357 RepID=A0A1Y5SGI7_9RHOB|nr:hypothetical protein [Roseisalinus antarcticus]SLN40184.1 hypothetical protein ROA7023_01557 [Roseisalinus antarcticus]
MAWLTDGMTRATDGERGRALAYLIVVLFGAGLTFVIVAQLENSGRRPFDPLTLYECWVILAGGIGAAGGLYLTGELMGTPGSSGWPRALRGVLILSFAGSVITGTLALPIYGTMFGPFSLFMKLASSPLLAVLWFSCLFAAHFLMVRWRQERDSIFVPIADLPRSPRAPSTSPLRKRPGTAPEKGLLDDEDAARRALETAAQEREARVTPESQAVPDPSERREPLRQAAAASPLRISKARPPAPAGRLRRIRPRRPVRSKRVEETSGQA